MIFYKYLLKIIVFPHDTIGGGIDRKPNEIPFCGQMI